MSGDRQVAALEQVVDVLAIAAVGGRAPGGRVRVAQQADVLQARELGAHGRGAPRHVRLVGQPPRADRLTARDVRLDDLLEQEALTLVDLHAGKFRSACQSSSASSSLPTGASVHGIRRPRLIW